MYNGHTMDRGGCMMSKEEKIKEHLLDEVNAYILQLVYLEDVHAVYKHIGKLLNFPT